MAESILVTGKKISSMELVTNVTGNEKIPTGQPDDLAVTPNQIADHTIARGDLASQEDLSQVEVSLGTQITDLESDVASSDNTIRGLIAAEEAARIAADNLKVDKAGSVSSVAGRVGDVALAPSDVLVDGFGSQEDVNKYVPKPFLSGYTYGLGERVVLSDGEVVKSLVDGNVGDPNVDMAGWVSMVSDSLATTVQTFNTPEAGVDPVTGVADGAYFNVRSEDDDTVAVEYQNIGGSVVATGKSYPSSHVVQGLQTFADNWIDVTNLLQSGSAAKAWNGSVLKAAITKATSLNKGLSCAPRGTVHLDEDIDFSGITQINFRTSIENPTGTIIVGGDANKGTPTDITFGSVTNGTSPLIGAAPTKPTFQIKGIKTGRVTLGNTNHLNIHATSGASTNSNAYFEIYPSVVRYTSITSDGTGNWNNELYVIGGRLSKLLIDGVGYVHNHIKFIRNTWEASSFTKVEMEFQRCHHVKVIDARFEGIDAESTILFGAGVRSCDIIGDWSGQNSPRSDFSGPAFTVTDLGMGNYVGKDRMERFDRSLILDINGASKIVANAVESDCTDNRIGSFMSPLVNKPYLVPHINGFSIGANRYLGLSDFIPVKYGDSLSYDCDYDHSDLRLAIFCYDENMSLMKDTSGGTELFAQPSVTFSATYSAYTVGPVPSSYFSISGSVFSPLVKYIRVGFLSTSSGYYRHVGVNLHTQKNTENKRVSFAKSKQKDMVLSSPPTMGLASVGDCVHDSVSGGKYICTMFKEAFTEVAFSSGLSAISTNDSSGVSEGDIVGIQLSSGLTQWTSVKSRSSGSIVIDPLEASVAVGARVVFIRWKSTIIMQTLSYDPPSIPAKSTHSVIMDVAGAVFANSVQASFNRFNAAISVDAAVSAADKVTVNFRNHSDSAVDLISGTIRVKVT